MKQMFAVLGAVLAVLAAPSVNAKTGDSPGKERWKIKTLILPTGENHNIDLPALLALESPPDVANKDKRYESRRMPAFHNSLGLKEGDTVTTSGYIQLIAKEGDGDYHVQITEEPNRAGNCLIVEVPNPRYVSAAYKTQVTRSRALLDSLVGHSPSASGSLLSKPRRAAITGALFYDNANVKRDGTAERRGKRHMSSGTLWELHPFWSVLLLDKEVVAAKG